MTTTAPRAITATDSDRRCITVGDQQGAAGFPDLDHQQWPVQVDSANVVVNPDQAEPSEPLLDVEQANRQAGSNLPRLGDVPAEREDWKYSRIWPPPGPPVPGGPGARRPAGRAGPTMAGRLARLTKLATASGQDRS
jgi:hypothetical protein